MYFRGVESEVRVSTLAFQFINSSLWCFGQPTVYTFDSVDGCDKCFQNPEGQRGRMSVIQYNWQKSSNRKL